MKFFNKKVIKTGKNKITFKNGTMELKNPLISAIDTNGNEVNVTLKYLKSSILYDNKFVFGNENLMFKSENLYMVLSYESMKVVYTNQKLGADLWKKGLKLLKLKI